MRQKNDVIRDLGAFKQKLGAKLPVQRMILFGSMAKGKGHKDSDIDLIVVSNGFKSKKSFKRSLGFYKYWNLGYPVDFLCYTPQEFNKLSKQVTIVREALKEGLEI